MLGGVRPHMGGRRGGRRRTDAISVYPGVRREAEGHISLPPHTRPSEPGERMLGRGFPRQNLASHWPISYFVPEHVQGQEPRFCVLHLWSS